VTRQEVVRRDIPKKEAAWDPKDFEIVPAREIFGIRQRKESRVDITTCKSLHSIVIGHPETIGADGSSPERDRVICKSRLPALSSATPWK
jgi:hypothetical protein